MEWNESFLNKSEMGYFMSLKSAALPSQFNFINFGKPDTSNRLSWLLLQSNSIKFTSPDKSKLIN